MRLVGAKMVSISALLLFAFAGMPALAEVRLNEQPEVASELGLPIVKWEDPTVKHAAMILAIHGIMLLVPCRNRGSSWKDHSRRGRVHLKFTLQAHHYMRGSMSGAFAGFEEPFRTEM
ncbi:MAG: hypothetical protein K2X93_23855 [Candidatus Obscuribacterales bacterium]|nr:hypothetical protein [Candidatus Obscuribacterales bacterium]